jgi:hypothetical protein
LAATCNEQEDDPVQQRSSHQPTARYTRTLADGGTLTIDGTTIPDPDTGQPVPAAPLRLPAWRLRDLATTLTSWTTAVATLVNRYDWPPDETDLCQALTAGADLLAAPTTR